MTSGQSSPSAVLRPAASPLPAVARRRVRWAPAAAAVVALLLVGCGDGGPGGIYGSDSPSPSTTGSTTTPTPTTSEASPSATTGPGCTPTEIGAPEDAIFVQVIDVDDDGRPDKAWISGGSGRSFGITTASGATFSTPIVSASPIPAKGVVNKVGADGTPIAIVDVGREALVYSLADCSIHQTMDVKGAPYTFDRGFGDQGTGVGCTAVDGVLQLAGLLATEEGSSWTVTRTFVDLSDNGTLATNGEKTVVATDAAATDPVVVTAQEVSCGDMVAGQDGLVEPEF
ncbi:hypothetical protein SAMN05216410_0623 [Sanguibacter gelidistatuariae]|uniref:Uncharacterized protein n=1 Tax=Sanguibacter gelidistatuariae TaxID=1814289 RepID=A0A1G6H0Q8_9MICO|nr:hypothetical protein [Sanguibacter gelidistatuariae]SDB87728.1 hypothetical protein SAMN05216410_0623 [Sanguibacter gelidistatuariae]